jgi:hypothetical protein
MSSITYSRPRLTTSADKRYRSYVEHYLLQRKNQRPMRPPYQRDIFGGQAEQALRGWLSHYLSLSDLRILEYEERRGKRASVKYRELDALAIHDKQTISVFEIKASRAANSLHRAASQLQETRSILRLLYKYISLTILFVDTGIPAPEEIAALMASPEHPRIPPRTLSETLEEMTEIATITALDARSDQHGIINCMFFTVDDIIALVGEDQLALDWSEDDEMVISQPNPTTTIYVTTEDNETEEAQGGALAEALRRAGLST